jgi:hypothetical protein
VFQINTSILGTKIDDNWKYTHESASCKNMLI